MKISIIICTYNKRQQLMRGLFTLIHQDLPKDVEILIIDDGSTDGTDEIGIGIPSTELTIRRIYLNHPAPRISCIPRNIGIKQATGEVIIFTEPEALQVGNTIHQLLQKMKEHPDNTILASQVWTTQQKIAKHLPMDMYMHPEKILTHPYAMLTDSEHPQNTNAPDSDWSITGELHCNAGVLFATRKAWLLKIGGFDESFTGHGFDDFDLFNRLAMIGHGVIKCSDIAVIHQWHEKNYPYNIYEAAERNGKISEANVHAGTFAVNQGRDWGKL